MASIILDIQGTHIAEDEIQFLQHPQTAGVILFSRNIASFDQIQDLCTALREVNSKLLICVDQEGGRVQRLIFEKVIDKLPPMRKLGQLYDNNPIKALEASESLGYLMASQVQALGIDFSFAPVFDRDYQHSSIIGDRAFHGDKQIISLLAEQFIKGMNKAGMQATAKHFPGHGFVVPDSHLELPIDEREFTQILSEDIFPFAENLKSEYSYKGVMPAHIVYEKVDSKPACFSKFWLQKQLRQALGFEGVIFSDDISMNGAAVIGDYAERTKQALLAGCDMVLICNTPEEQENVLTAAAEINKAENPVWQSFKAKQYLELSDIQTTQKYQQALAVSQQLLA